MVFEIAQRLTPGVGLDLNKRLQRHEKSTFKMDFDFMKVKFTELNTVDNEKNDFEDARQLLRVYKLLIDIRESGNGFS